MVEKIAMVEDSPYHHLNRRTRAERNRRRERYLFSNADSENGEEITSSVESCNSVFVNNKWSICERRVMGNNSVVNSS